MLLTAQDLRYPAVFTKFQKFVLQRSCKNSKLAKGKLHYKEQIQDGTDSDQLVVKRSETDRDFLKCHLTEGRHRGRDATIGKVKERYYWKTFCKEIEEMIHMASSSYFYLEYS